MFTYAISVHFILIVGVGKRTWVLCTIAWYFSHIHIIISIHINISRNLIEFSVGYTPDNVDYDTTDTNALASKN